MSNHLCNKVILRCPICFNNGVDTYLKHDRGTYQCLKCSYTGTLQNVEEMYDGFRKRYRLLDVRMTLEEQRKL